MATLGLSRLFWKLFSVVFILFSSITLVSSGYWGYCLYNELLEEFYAQGKTLARSMAESSIDLIVNDDAGSIQANINDVVSIGNVSYMAVYNRDHVLIAHSFTPIIPAKMKPLYQEHFHSKTLTKTVTYTFDTQPYGKVLHMVAPVLFGEVGYIHLGMSLAPILDSITTRLIQINLVISVLFLLSIIILYIVMRTISRPIITLSHYTNALSTHDFSSTLDTHSTIQQLATSSNEIGQLAHAFLHLEQSLIDYVATLKKTLAEKHSMEREMAIGRQIQLGMLPKKEQFSFLSQLQLDMYLKPVTSVGGDLYDCLLLPNRHVAFVIGDVSGKGVPAALFMAKTVTLFRVATQWHDTASDIVTWVNHQLCQHNEESLFVTVFFAILNLQTGELNYVNGGHCPPYHYSAQQEPIALPLTHGMALGISDHYYYDSKSITLSPHDRLFLYTDGITEGRNPNKHLYTEQRLKDCLNQAKAQDNLSIGSIVLDHLNDFIQSNLVTDDIAYLSLEWTPHAKHSNTLTFYFDNDIAEIKKLHHVIHMFGQSHQFSDNTIRNLKLCLEEILSNTIQYAYDDHGLHKIYCQLRYENQLFSATIQDDGKAFNPLDCPPIDKQASLEDKPIGGLGIHIVKSLMSDVRYERIANKNVLIMEKVLTQEDINASA